MIALKNVDGLAAKMVDTIEITYAYGTWRSAPTADPDWVPMDVADAARELAAGRAVTVLLGDVEAVQRETKRLLAGEVAA